MRTANDDHMTKLVKFMADNPNSEFAFMIGMITDEGVVMVGLETGNHSA